MAQFVLDDLAQPAAAEPVGTGGVGAGGVGTGGVGSALRPDVGGGGVPSPGRRHIQSPGGGAAGRPVSAGGEAGSSAGTRSAGGGVPGRTRTDCVSAASFGTLLRIRGTATPSPVPWSPSGAVPSPPRMVGALPVVLPRPFVPD